VLTIAFWKAALERALKSAAQGAVAAIGADAAGVFDVPWPAVLAAAGLMAVLSLLTSAGSGAVTGAGPSLTGAEATVGAPAADGPGPGSPAGGAAP